MPAFNAPTLILTHLTLSAGLSIFWQQLGVEPNSATMARLGRVTAGRHIFDDDELLRRRHDALRDAIGEDAARVILLRQPLLLTHDLEAKIGPKLRALGELLPGVNVSHAVLRAPSLLQLAETTIAPRLEVLERRLGSRAAVVKAVARAPTLLNLRDVDARFDRLCAALPGLSEADVARIVGQQPSLLAFNDESIRAKAAALATLFRVSDASLIIRRDARVVQLVGSGAKPAMPNLLYYYNA